MTGQAKTTRRMWMVLGLAAALMATTGPAMAQDAPAGQDGAGQNGGARHRGQFGGGQFAGMQRAGGEVTGVSGATVTIKTEAGETMQIVTTDNTRVMKGRPNEGGGTIKVSDLKVGDGVMAVGNLDAANKTLHAAMILATDAAVLAKAKADLGKTYIVGKVMAIDMDNAKMTVLRSDGVSQTIGFDETTSFRRGRVNAGMMMGEGGGERRRGGNGAGANAGGESAESITLADIKVGDNVAGRGAIKSGVFVPTEVVVGTPGQRRQRQGAPEAGAASPAQPQ
ncbi:hypothetical protein GOB94_11755 [Granulicella sp. 5B5]|uniref:hypothetical protein n=1 Tax=Granulicella sp. 5B5 TaxID=1617967 RepID=UPI0015F711B7|nr:hypothetical protein [Granulicella sp. 5B5]QMV19281.1 hypothetical protein GOB94_11755 [Granulicella sp. 5B5]